MPKSVEDGKFMRRVAVKRAFGGKLDPPIGFGIEIHFRLQYEKAEDQKSTCLKTATSYRRSDKSTLTREGLQKELKRLLSSFLDALFLDDPKLQTGPLQQ